MPVSFLDQRRHIVSADVFGLIIDVADVIDFQINTLLRDRQQMMNADAVTQMTDNDLVHVGPELIQHGDLFHRQSSPASRMRRDRNASPCLSQRGGSEHSFFARLDKVSTGTDFTDESRSNSGVADPDFNLLDKHIGQFAAGQFFDDLWIIEFAIPTETPEGMSSLTEPK